MVAERKEPTITVEEYLALEAVSQAKHEYVHGYVYAMAGGTALITTPLPITSEGILANHIGDEGPCRVNGPDLRVRVHEAIYYYPDAVVDCDNTISDAAIEVTTHRICLSTCCRTQPRPWIAAVSSPTTKHFLP